MSLRSWAIRGLILAGVALLAAFGWIANSWVSPERVRAQVIATLDEQLEGVEIHVGSAHMRILGGIAVSDLRLTRRAADGTETPLLAVPSAVLYHDKEQLNRGRLVIKKVELETPGAPPRTRAGREVERRRGLEAGPGRQAGADDRGQGGNDPPRRSRARCPPVRDAHRHQSHAPQRPAPGARDPGPRSRAGLWRRQRPRAGEPPDGRAVARAGDARVSARARSRPSPPSGSRPSSPSTSAA